MKFKIEKHEDERITIDLLDEERQLIDTVFEFEGKVLSDTFFKYLKQCFEHVAELVQENLTE